MTAARRLLLVISLVLTSLAFTGEALAVGGNYVFEGGSAQAQAQVRRALDRSAFDWTVVPGTVTIRITSCGCAGSRPGEIILDEGRLTSTAFGRRYAWGIVQHEYAHQLDFALLDAIDRRRIERRLGASAWCYEVSGLAHDDYGCERFATLVAWAYWPSRRNVQRPDWRPASARPMRPARVRAFVARLLAG